MSEQCLISVSNPLLFFTIYWECPRLLKSLSLSNALTRNHDLVQKRMRPFILVGDRLLMNYDSSILFLFYFDRYELWYQLNSSQPKKKKKNDISSIQTNWTSNISRQPMLIFYIINNMIHWLGFNILCTKILFYKVLNSLKYSYLWFK